ncbi:histidine phosphatase family protein [Kitasatospora mediocidica]|uniref:histidine phosphatase family protein n=1 Tax=Kitasatospora mediocidica TaxID=58352 RepID=UPI00056BBDCE|nr:histidine phosphatase family protein [Kitasatospora mediocidica]
MTGTVTRYLYLVRHGEALRDESGLTENGRRQAVLLGRRLREVPFAAVHHGPLPRAAQTARLIGEQLGGVPLQVSELAGDYVPYWPQRDELPPDAADFLLTFLNASGGEPGGESAEQRSHGPELARQAVERFTGPARPADDSETVRHELVVTHNFLVAWLVRHATDAPAWRWLGLNQANAGLTVIRYAPGRPSSVLCFNDLRHLPADLRWTGVPPELHV